MRLLSVLEPRGLIHAPDKCGHATEIKRIALAEALFMRAYANASG